MSKEIGPREKALREMRERQFARSTPKRSVGTKKILAAALRQQAAAVPVKKRSAQTQKRSPQHISSR